MASCSAVIKLEESKGRAVIVKFTKGTGNVGFNGGLKDPLSGFLNPDEKEEGEVGHRYLQVEREGRGTPCGGAISGSAPALGYSVGVPVLIHTKAIATPMYVLNAIGGVISLVGTISIVKVHADPK